MIVDKQIAVDKNGKRYFEEGLPVPEEYQNADGNWIETRNYIRRYRNYIRHYSDVKCVTMHMVTGNGNQFNLVFGRGEK